MLKIQRAREAVVEFFKMANPQDEFFLITFADQPEEISDFTQSLDDIQSKLVYTIPKGRTSLLDAIYLGISKMRQARYQKKALVLRTAMAIDALRAKLSEFTAVVEEVGGYVLQMTTLDDVAFGQACGEIVEQITAPLGQFGKFSGAVHRDPLGINVCRWGRVA